MAEYRDSTQIANYEHFTDSVAVTYAASQTNATVITPSSGKRLRIHDVFVNVGATSGTVELEFADSGYVFYRFEATASSSRDHVLLREVGHIDEAIRITSTQGSNNLNLHINYAEVTDATGSEHTTTSTSTSTSSTTTSSSTSSSTTTSTTTT